MCGICGTAGFSDRDLLKKMTDAIIHRGPDDDGYFISADSKIALGNRRLSILDLTKAGHMPMCDSSGLVWITYNGEVYNSKEHRTSLMSIGYSFKSSSDTETVLQLYMKYGVDSFEKLNGMFAFALWDSRTEELFIVRDRFGIKPLYFSNTSSGLLFGSEVKSLLCHSDVPRECNVSCLGSYLTHLWVPGPSTMFKNVRKLSPGHYLRWCSGSYSEHVFWRMSWPPLREEPERVLADNLMDLLKQAVSRNMISDVPFGLLLSGGIDSTIILSLMTELSGRSQDVYTIIFRDEDSRLEQAGSLDERYAKVAAKEYRARYHAIEIEPDIASHLQETLFYLDEPVADPAAINSLLIARRASNEVKILLSGQGADEIFGGYRIYLIDRMCKWISLIPKHLRLKIAIPLLKALPKMGSIPGMHKGYLMAVSRYFTKILYSADLPQLERYLQARTYHSSISLERLFTEDCYEAMKSHNPNHMHKSYFDEVSEQAFLNQMMYVDMKTFLPELNLTYLDKMGMAASIEARVPFLDNDLVNFMASVPPRLKVKGLTGKYLLRKAVVDSVPGSILRRRKAGFGAPIRKWLSGDLVELTNDLLSEETIRRRGYFQYEEVTSMLKLHREGRADFTYQIWALLVLEIWMAEIVKA